MPQNIQCTQVLKMAISPLSLIKKNVSYMAGYLIKRYPIENCVQCHDQLMIEKLPEPSSVSQYKLLRFKIYREINCHVYPSIVFSDFVKSIEDLFCALFGGVMMRKTYYRHCVQIQAMTYHRYISVVMLMQSRFPTLECPLVTKEIERCSNYATNKIKFIFVHKCL